MTWEQRVKEKIRVALEGVFDEPDYGPLRYPGLYDRLFRIVKEEVDEEYRRLDRCHLDL